jgi:hypothetical protein
MHLRPLGARLTATQAELILTDSNDLFNLRAHPIEAAHLHGRQHQAVGGKVFGAVSDDQHFEAARQPAGFRPVRMAPISPQRLAVKPAILFETANKVPPIVANPLQEGSGGIPGIEQHKLGAAAQAIAGIAEQLKGEFILRRSALMPEAHAQWDAHGTIRPD